MLTLLLTLSLVVQEPTLLKHAEKHTFSLGPSDPILEGVGPSKTFRYEIESDDAVLFIWARSEELDLTLRAKIDGASDSAGKPKSGAAALFAGRRREPILEDDDSGGLTNPFLRIKHQGGGTLTIHVAAKPPLTESLITVHCFEAQETAATRAAAATADPALAEAKRLWAAGEHAVARQQLAERVDALIAEVGAERSAAINRSIFELGLEVYLFGELEAAHRARSKAYRFNSQTLPEEHLDLQTARGNLANTFYALGDLHGARALEETVLEVNSKTLPEEHPALQRARNNLAATLKALGDLPAARALQEQVLEVRSKTLPEDHPDLQDSRGNLANTLFDLGDLPAARALEETVLEISSKTLPNEHPALQRARNNLAATLEALGDLPAARALQEQVLEVNSKTLPEEHPHLQTARGNLAATLRALGDLHGARTLQEQVLEVLSRTLPGEHPTLQWARSNLAATLRALGDLHGARALQEQVLEISSKTLPKEHPDLHKAQEDLAATLQALGDLHGARALQEQVLEVNSKTLPEEHPHLQLARTNLAGTLQALGDLPAARALQEQVLEISSKTLPKEHPELQRARAHLAWTLARMNEADGSRELARVLARQTRRAAQQFHLFSARELEARASGDVERYSARTALSIAGGLGIFPTDPEGDRLDFSMTEALRSTVLQARRLSRAWARDPASESVRRELAEVNREVSRLAGGGEDRDAFSQAIRKRDRLQRQLMSRLEEGSEESGLPDLEASTIAARLSPREAAIGYWRYRRSSLDPETFEKKPVVDSYLAWVLRPGQELRRIELGAAEAIEGAIEQWRAAIGAPSRRGMTREEGAPAEDAGQAVRQLVIDPLSEAIGEATTLVIAPADAMYVLPFEALPEGEGLLGDRISIRYRLALSELTIEESGELAEPSLLAFGGIDYNRREEREESASAEPSYTADSRSAGAPLSLLRGSKTNASFSWSFGKLVETRGEALAVSEYFLDAFEDDGADEPTVLTRKKATRDAFERLAPRHRYLHLATHGWFAPESVPSVADANAVDEKSGLGKFTDLRDQVRGLAPSLLCGLAFAGANGDADQYGRVRGVMTAEEIGAMDLSGVELCVLSACETNVGLRRGGQGIASLQAALHAAGARTAITSLWKVPDEATRELMDELYRQLWILKKPKAEALWNAKQKLRRQLNEDDQPVYTIRDWAGWVLSGDPD